MTDETVHAVKRPMMVELPYWTEVAAAPRLWKPASMLALQELTLACLSRSTLLSVSQDEIRYSSCLLRVSCLKET